MDQEIIIIGAGASGLMVARELARAGKKVLILEARDRIGGRIWPLSEDEFGYPAQGGAEFVHGEAPFTKALAKEAGMTLIKTRADMWDAQDGKLMINGVALPNQDELHQKLKELEQDMPVLEFLNTYFAEEKYNELRKGVLRTVEGYDAADPALISTFVLREEWLGGQEWIQYRVKEGYGALLAFFEAECRRYGVEIILNSPVRSVHYDGGATVVTTDQKTYQTEKIIITVPPPVLETIKFIPAIPDKLTAARQIGWGKVIKLVLCFKSRWWVKPLGKDFGEMDFIRSDQAVSTWWTQPKEFPPALIGWIAGPKTERFTQSTSEEIIAAGIESLANIFNVSRELLEQDLMVAKAFNWPVDPFTRGAYSYSTPESEKAYEELRKPVGGRLFFAGEALYSGKDTATVEGALGSGKEVAEKILSGNF